MYALLFALLVSVVGVIPLIILVIQEKEGLAMPFVTGFVLTLIWWFIFYNANPSLVWPLGGLIGWAVALNWIVSTIVGAVAFEKAIAGAVLSFIGVVILVIAALSGWSLFRASEYRNLIGQVEPLEFTKDMQPSDPAHIRIVPAELAVFMADKQLGEAEGGSIGSQYQVAKSFMTIQRIKGELWWVAPLDYNGFSVWTSVGTVPGYVKVSAEDPYQAVELVLGKEYRYTPGAYFSDDLERYLWSHGYVAKGLTDYSFEEDEDGKAWWVVSVFEPTISYWGEKITGVVVVDPTTGDISPYDKDEIPEWIDRAIPREFAVDYIKGWGMYVNGWWNTIWGKKNLVDVTPMGRDDDFVEIVYGADGEPYWFTGITSASSKDSALVSVMYMHSRTGAAKEYRIAGLTEEAILHIVDNEIEFKGWKGSVPMLFNFYGRPMWVSTVLGQSNTFKGVALVDAENQKIYWDEEDPFGGFAKLRAELGMEQIAVPLATSDERVAFEGTVGRIALEGASYYVLLNDLPHALVGTKSISLDLVFTQPGDSVKGEYVQSGEDIYSLAAFDNLAVELKPSAKQAELRERTAEKKAEVRKADSAKDAKKEIKNMSDEEVQELLKLKKAQEESKK